MRVLDLGRLAPLALGSLLCSGACAPDDDDIPWETIVDIQGNALIEQPAGQEERVIKMTVHRQGELAKHSLSFFVQMFAEIPEPVERVRIGALVPESESDTFVSGDGDQENVTGGQVELPPCARGEACTSVFTSVVQSSSPMPAGFDVTLWGSLMLRNDWEVSEVLQVELAVEP